MRLIIHDTDLTREQLGCLPADMLIAAKERNMNPCIGCFGCWLKTPGVCVIADDIQDMGKLFCAADEILLISRCAYGGYSPLVKNVFDRSIGFLLPFFTIRADGRMHHLIREEKPRALRVYFYGDATEKERDAAERVVRANAVNINAASHETSFYPDAAAVAEVLA